MKKVLIPVLALALTLSMSVNAFAATTIDREGGSHDIEVNAKYVDSTATPTVYDVNVAWGAMEFTYTVSGAKLWNSEKHTYDVTTSNTWTATGNEITVTNHSNTAIKADFAYNPQTDYNTVTGSFSRSSITLPTAEGKAVNDASLVGSTALTLGGTLASDRTELTKVGTVTVAISKA